MTTEKWDKGELIGFLAVVLAMVLVALFVMIATIFGCATAPSRVATERAAAYAMRDCREAAKHLPPTYADRLCSERVAEICGQGRLGADCWAEQWALVRK